MRCATLYRDLNQVLDLQVAKKAEAEKFAAGMAAVERTTKMKYTGLLKACWHTAQAPGGYASACWRLFPRQGRFAINACCIPIFLTSRAKEN